MMSKFPLCLSTMQFSDLASFLIARACRSTQLTNYFYWYLSVECAEDKDQRSRVKYERIRLKFLDDLKNVSVLNGYLCSYSLVHQLFAGEKVERLYVWHTILMM